MKIAIIQLTSVLDPKTNLNKIHSLIHDAKKSDPKLEAIFLPEVFYSMSDGNGATPYLVEGENEHYQNIQNIAIKHNVFVLGGSAATLVDGKVFNRSYNFSPKGVELGLYDKIHLFSVNLTEGNQQTNLNEGRVYSSGKSLKTINFGDFNLGLSICFDLRFPELFRRYHKLGVNILSISSAFTVPTGKAHWEILLRARAIENQSYIVASAQYGKHNEKISTYGHSMIIDPWGKVIAECDDGENLKIAEIDLKLVNEVRARMNISEQLTT